MKKLELPEIQQLLFGIAKEFHRVCVKHNIPYYMLGGTMLGAIRHNGFIPWDDDMDLGVPREYYYKLLSILKVELPRRYKIITDQEWFAPIVYYKIEDNCTIAEMKEDKSKSMTHGLYIDIFPLDNCSSDLKITKWIFKKQKILNAIHSARFTDYREYSLSKRIILKILSIIPYSKQKWIRNYKLLEAELEKTGNDAMVNFSGIYKNKEILDKTIFGKPRLYTFEDFELYGPELADEFLTHMYGNYMQLPPVEKRHTHSFDVLLK